MTNLTDANLTALETAVLQMILDGDHPVLKSLRSQFESCHVTNRWFSGVGFFTSLHSEIDTVTFPNLNIPFGDVLAEINGLQHRAGFVLFVENGRLNTLEGYCYDEPWPDQVTNFSLRYSFSNLLGDNAGLRNWEALNMKLDTALTRTKM